VVCAEARQDLLVQIRCGHASKYLILCGVLKSCSCTSAHSMLVHHCSSCQFVCTSTNFGGDPCCRCLRVLMFVGLHSSGGHRGAQRATAQPAALSMPQHCTSHHLVLANSCAALADCQPLQQASQCSYLHFLTARCTRGKIPDSAAAALMQATLRSFCAYQTYSPSGKPALQQLVGASFWRVADASCAPSCMFACDTGEEVPFHQGCRGRNQQASRL
jgi:hypothetical protein